MVCSHMGFRKSGWGWQLRARQLDYKTTKAAQTCVNTAATSTQGSSHERIFCLGANDPNPLPPTLRGPNADSEKMIST